MFIKIATPSFIVRASKYVQDAKTPLSRKKPVDISAVNDALKEKFKDRALTKLAISGAFAGKILKRVSQRAKDAESLGVMNPNMARAAQDRIKHQGARIEKAFAQRSEGLEISTVKPRSRNHLDAPNLPSAPRVSDQNLLESIKAKKDTQAFQKAQDISSKIFKEPNINPNILEKTLTGPISVPKPQVSRTESFPLKKPTPLAPEKKNFIQRLLNL